MRGRKMTRERPPRATQEDETGVHSDVWPALAGVADLDIISEDRRTRAGGKQLANAN